MRTKGLQLAVATGLCAALGYGALQALPVLPTAPAAKRAGRDAHLTPVEGGTRAAGPAEDGAAAPKTGASPEADMAAVVGAISEVDLKNRDAFLLSESGDVKGAIGLLREARRLDPDNELVAKNLQAALINTGYAQLELDRFTDAAGAFVEALGIGDRSEIRRGLGYAYYRLGNVDLARVSLERALDQGGADSETYLTLGRIYLERHDQTRALAMFEEAIALGADRPGLADTVDRLRREAAIEEEYHELASSHFTLKFEGRENTSAGRLVLNALEDAYRRVGARFAYYPLERLEVILYPDEAFREVTNTPHWSGAVYDGRIKLPVGGLQKGSERLARTLRHEYAHAAIVTLSRSKAPVWLNEGLAQVAEESDDAGRTGRLRAAIADEGLLPLTSLESNFTRFDREQASLAYAEAHAAAAYLLEKKGGYNVRRLLEAMATAESTDAAFRQALSMSYADFDERFLADIDRRLR